MREVIRILSIEEEGLRATIRFEENKITRLTLAGRKSKVLDFLERLAGGDVIRPVATA